MDYRFLHYRVTDLFADHLKSNIQNLKKQEPVRYYDCFPPNMGSSVDRTTRLCESIARTVFPRESYPDYQGLEEARYSSVVRDGLRKEVLVPLNKYLAYEEPWKGKAISFSPNPELHSLATLEGGEDNDLKFKCEFVRRMDCGGEVDFQKVFDLILQVAVNENLRPDQMIKRVFVLTDYKCFGRAWANTSSFWESDYEAIQNKYKEKGYGDAVPQIVFWELEAWGTPVVPCRGPGVATLGCFSNKLFKLFLDNNGELGPHHVMEAAISGKEYQNLVVVD